MFLTDFKKSLVKRIIDGFFISAKELVSCASGKVNVNEFYVLSI